MERTRNSCRPDFQSFDDWVEEDRRNFDIRYSYEARQKLAKNGADERGRKIGAIAGTLYSGVAKSSKSLYRQ
jgi:hypothetical protein